MIKTIGISLAGAAGLLIAWTAIPDTLREMAAPASVCVSGVHLKLGVETPLTIAFDPSLRCEGAIKSPAVKPGETPTEAVKVIKRLLP